MATSSVLGSLKPRYTLIEDVSDGHTIEGFKDGRSLTEDGRELLVLVVSDMFEGRSLVERHQLVQDCFKEDLESGNIHAIQIRAWTVKKWIKKGSPLEWPDKQTKFIPAHDDQTPENSSL